ncbi:ricin-type beta-trefoil lectin domain protein [Streptomyces roseicoloratus]|uniref:ricin-type beta-trefoil lectin domain protein n=1 Tax=Streptomyces roseicoloratus TaxID=2508722 RepID=UPI001FE5E260|nr:ricin-type beta-trefoil lectin domain protein [Streptomyces roseicoloratus]
MQETDSAPADEQQIESHATWSGTPAEPPAEYAPRSVAPLATATDSVDLSGVGDGLRPVGNLPVSLGRATMGTETTAPEPSGQWEVEVKPEEATEAEALNGAVIKVTPPPTGSTPVDLELDYSRFQDLYGTEWATRLRLVQLPECFLTSPELDECNVPVDVPSTNDPVAKTIRATVDPAESPVQGFSTQSGGGPTVLAATDSGAGAGGTYRATSLSASGTWTAGGSGGGFSWSHPLTVPAPPAGPAPKIAFNYSSQSVDGKTSVSNGQASWIGDGWDYHPGYVERRYRTCSDDLTNGNNNNATDKKKSDLCWASDNVVLSLAGSTTELVHDGTRWVPASDDGSKVEYLDAAGNVKTTAQNAAYGNEHWRVTTQDGTRYYFGRNDVDGSVGSRPLTNSVSKVPVFGNQSGEPCHQATFAGSSCQQAWRWNLDYAEDVHGNAMVIDWKQETNLYARNGKFKPAVSYDRASHPTQISYGLRAGNLGGAPAAQVVFATGQRCLPGGIVSCSDTEFDSKNYEDKQPWWDTPSTLHCKSTTTNCYVTSPTFWSRLKLNSVTTKAQRTTGSTELSVVDIWTLQHSFPRQRTETHPPLWLESISRTGHGAAGSKTSAPLAVSFLPNMQKDMPNRVVTGPNDPTPGFNRLRVETIRTETGGEIQVEYSDPCLPSNIPASPQANSTRCFPAKWSPDPEVENPRIEWFNKYVVKSVTEKDRAASQPDVRTTYDYESTGGSRAWAKSTDEFVKPELRTYDQWRGYDKVTVKKGITVTPDEAGSPTTEQSQTVTRYLRGMSGDGSGEITGAQVKVSFKKADGTSQEVEDLLPFQGRAVETITYTRAGGTEAGREVGLPTATTTATRSRGTGVPALRAYRVGTEWSQSIETLSDGTTRTKVSDPTHETTYGLPVSSYTYTLGADKVTKSDEICAKTTYVHNTAAHLIGLPSRVRATVGTCAAAATATGNQIISDVRTSYDALNAFGTTPTKGLPRQVDTVDEDGIDWITSARTDYDALGRVTRVLDAEDNATTTTYNPATGPAFQITVTNALGHATTTAFDPGRGTALSATDANGRKTVSTFDELGRVVAVWSPSRNPDSDSPSARFTYQVDPDRIPAVTSETLRDDGSYAVSVALYDGHLRPRQTQTDAVGGGRIVTDTLYNANGTVAKTKNGYHEESAPEPKLFFPDEGFTDYDVPNATETSYDGLGRPVRTVTVHKGSRQYSSTLEYGGDWTLSRIGMSPKGTTPLSGSRAVKTWTDAADRTVKVEHYTKTDLTAALKTTYDYDARGKLATVTDPDGNGWSYAYDVRGRLKTTSDPDMGAAEFGYDDLDRKVWSKDSLQRTQHTVYDALGRQTELHDDAEGGPLVAKWTYDSLPGGKGLPVASTRYNDGAAYTSEVTGYDTEYRPTGSRITIPDVDKVTTGLAGTYTYGNTYTRTGKPQSVTLPATPGGLAAEKVITRYNASGAPIMTSGLSWYTADVIYGPQGQVMRTTSGESGRRVWTTNEYDESTGRVTKTQNHREAAQPSLVSTQEYGYDTVGNVTSITETQPAAKIDLQCFSYDPMGRLVHAWTGKTGCPAATTGEGAGPNLTQVSTGVDGSGYWHSYAFDTIGNRTSLTVHDLTDATLDDTYSYTYGKKVGTEESELVQPHTLVQADAKVVTGTAASPSSVESISTYAYDATGNTTQRVIGGDTQNLTWDRRNKVTSVSGFGNGGGALVNPESGKCLDVPRGNTTDGTALLLWSCNGGKNQEWKASGGTLTSLGKCATVNGTALVLSTCVEKNAAQQFVSRPDDKSLYNQASDKCVVITGTDYPDGASIQLASCDQSNAQKWTPGDTTTYLYDAAGSRLIENTATTRTLYLGDSEITVDSAGKALNARRYYGQPGAPTTVRNTGGKATGHQLTVMLADHHGTSTTSIDQSTDQTVTRRYYDPYGNPRGAEPTAWPDRRTFLGTGVDDSTTGLTHIGAREYDPTLGRFLSADPIIDITDPLQMNGYTYANGSPVTKSDPTGLISMDCWQGFANCQGGKEVSATDKGKKGALPSRDELLFEKVNFILDAIVALESGPPKKWPRNNFSVGGKKVAQMMAKFDPSNGSVTDQLSFKMWAAGASNEEIEYFRNNYCKFVTCYSPLEAALAGTNVDSPLYDKTTGQALGEAFAAGLASRTGPQQSQGRCPNSFVPGTEVLLADGSSKPIEDLLPGDEVLATDPESGVNRVETVTAEIKGQGHKHLIKITVDVDGAAGAKTARITATDGHPFWVPEQGEWVDATDLQPGDWLQTSVGTYVQVAAIERSTVRNGVVYNLTVSNLHTYYVLAGQTPVLVHNSNCPIVARITPGSLPPAEEAALGRTLSHIDAGTVPTGPTARRWGIPFRNREGNLPGGQGSSSPYREYRVEPPPGTPGAGPLRVVRNDQTGETYYTWTHYGDSGDPAFVQVR